MLPEMLRPYDHYIILLLLNKLSEDREHRVYKIWHLSPEEFNRLKTFVYNGHKYAVDRRYLMRLHGWCPWLTYNPWSPWRSLYNKLY